VSAVVADGAAVVQPHAPLAGVQRHRGPAQLQVGVERGQRLLVAQHDAVRPAAGQQLFGQRRPVMRRMRLVADQLSAPS
jgi:hypothetical protein